MDPVAAALERLRAVGSVHLERADVRPPHRQVHAAVAYGNCAEDPDYLPTA
jgi:hypothetical protein